jgi:uncharacterized membrane protein YfcA
MTTLIAGSTAWFLIALGAFLVGFAKTSFGGMTSISTALFAAVISVRESTAALLLVLLVGDVIAVCLYRRDGDWRLLSHLVPGVLPGLAVGAGVLAVIDDQTLKRVIGATLLVLVLLQLWLSARATSYEQRSWSPVARVGSGVAAGVTTMVANAAGPVMAIYLAGQRVDKRRFLGTSAWFFLCINLTKVPFSLGLGLIRTEMLWVTVLLMPLVVLGALIGRRVVHGIHQRAFDMIVIATSALSAVALLVT